MTNMGTGTRTKNSVEIREEDKGGEKTEDTTTDAIIMTHVMGIARGVMKMAVLTNKGNTSRDNFNRDQTVCSLKTTAVTVIGVSRGTSKTGEASQATSRRRLPKLDPPSPLPQ